MRTFLVTFLFSTYRHNIYHLPYFSTPFTDLTFVHVVINSCPSDYPPTVHGTSMCLPLEASSTTGSPLDTRQGTVKDFLHSAKDTRRRKSR